jgi:hypothetical protein
VASRRQQVNNTGVQRNCDDEQFIRPQLTCRRLNFRYTRRRQLQTEFIQPVRKVTALHSLYVVADPLDVLTDHQLHLLTYGLLFINHGRMPLQFRKMTYRAGLDQMGTIGQLSRCAGKSLGRKVGDPRDMFDWSPPTGRKHGLRAFPGLIHLLAFPGLGYPVSEAVKDEALVMAPVAGDP